jgi:hypothetical protein
VIEDNHGNLFLGCWGQKTDPPDAASH